MRSEGLLRRLIEWLRVRVPSAGSAGRSSMAEHLRTSCDSVHGHTTKALDRALGVPPRASVVARGGN